MPIYAYRCTACGYENEHIQKLADAPLRDCPSCKAQTYGKRLTAAAFQLKGSGWYATDFKGGGAASAPAKAEATTESSGASTAGGACGTGSCGCH
ncbi:zinc ribbon domain-containing protein [Chitiniphilus purpureus]|uniref:Zinc ribbon domain-containing protein n=1 Tax=Chitiniphilus purpureus TaxID=2981137 RepID=A0ABY6DP20_9NEIS|nr:FmdB family zinc ribbon protein [Chitiniphilus sp. CD1]UXY14841.1 zinc ribbon domain-containing protein [Chitiniphilus sp. CD1]